MRKTRRCHRLREVPAGPTTGGRLEGRRQAAAGGIQGRPTTATLAGKLLVRAAQLVAAVALSQLSYRLVPWLALPVPSSVIAVGLLLSLASHRFVPARAFEKAVALVTRR
jgi:hypothetical protein